MSRRILVIRLGALGDVALSFPAFAAIRAHHAGDCITALTTAPYAGLLRDSPWFDTVDIDARPGWTDLRGLWRLLRQLAGYDFVYDLQTSARSSHYFRLAGRPPWSGIAPGCSAPDADPGRNDLHTVARQRGQLAASGVRPAAVSLGWLIKCGPVLGERYALLVPGTSSAHGGAKKWPVERFAAVATMLNACGIRPVVVGTAAETADAACIVAACPAALDLTAKTSVQDLAGLAHRAALAVGGDTGPIHLAGAMGCRVLALFSRFSDPVLATPVGQVRLLRAPCLQAIGVAEVVHAIRGGGTADDWSAE